MKQYILSGLVFILIVLVGVAIVKGVFLKPANAGLRIESLPQSSVFLDGKSLGKTPYEEEKLPSGERILKLVPEGGMFSPWEAKVKLYGGTMTVVRREFGETESNSSGEIITLEKTADKKTASLSIISFPDSAMVKVNNQSRGFTPLLLEKLSEQEIEIIVSAPGFKEKTVKTKLVGGFKTIVNVKLKQSKEETLTGTPTPTPSASPSGSLSTPHVQIKETPTGWLRVRSEPSKNAKEVGKVYPKEKYSLLGEESGWYKIEYKKGEEGWISGQYAQKITSL